MSDRENANMKYENEDASHKSDMWDSAGPFPFFLKTFEKDQDLM